MILDFSLLLIFYGVQEGFAVYELRFFISDFGISISDLLIV